MQDFMVNAGPDTMFIFINSQNDYCWYALDKKDLWKDMSPVTIHKTLREDVNTESLYASLYDEVVYVYTKNENTMKEVKKMEIKKELPHVGIDISKFPLAEDQERIKMLEGILEATEQRLLYYIDKVKELEQEK